jgi:hypothetical protein
MVPIKSFVFPAASSASLLLLAGAAGFGGGTVHARTAATIADVAGGNGNLTTLLTIISAQFLFSAFAILIRILGPTDVAFEDLGAD